MSSSLIIQQSANVQIKPEEEAHLECYHGDNNYPYMLWYQHKSVAEGQRAMELVGQLHYESANLEKNFEAHFNITGHSKGRAQLVISNINPTDSAVYFCAARMAQCYISFGLVTKSWWPYLICTCFKT